MVFAELRQGILLVGGSTAGVGKEWWRGGRKDAGTQAKTRG